jgi:hypothetical protein
VKGKRDRSGRQGRVEVTQLFHLLQWLAKVGARREAFRHSQLAIEIYLEGDNMLDRKVQQ